jgi:hypothetical protein
MAEKRYTDGRESKDGTHLLAHASGAREPQNITLLQICRVIFFPNAQTRNNRKRSSKNYSAINLVQVVFARLGLLTPKNSRRFCFIES